MKYSVLKSRRKTRKTAIIAILAILALQGTLQAQYSQYYYHRTGDTIEHDSPVYFHAWWKWLDHHFSRRLLYFNLSKNLCDTTRPRLLQHYTPDTMKIVGIAGLSPIRSVFEREIFQNYDTTQKVHLYIVGDDPFAELAKIERGRWWDDAHRMIHIVSTANNPNLDRDMVPPEEQISGCCFDHPLDDYFGVFEYYFDSAISVVDTFYVGTTSTPLLYETHEYPSLVNDCDDNLCDNLNEYTYLRKYPPLFPDWTKWRTLPVYLVWPIIEIDTTVPPDFVCLPLEDLHVTALDTFAATVAWSDVSSQTTEVQVRYGPTATPNANWRTLTVAGGSRSATLGLPREEFADYAVMVRPLCDSLKTSAAWSDTVFFSLPRDTVGILSPHAAGFTLQPNPAMGSVSVTLAEGVALPAEVEVVDMAGRTVLARRATSPTLTLPLDGLPAGTYLVRAAGHTQRLVKQ